MCCLLFFICWLTGGNTSIENNPRHDGDDGTSFLSQLGVPFLSIPLKGNVKKKYHKFEDCQQHIIRKCVFSVGYICKVYYQELMCLYFLDNERHGAGYWRLKWLFVLAQVVCFLRRELSQHVTNTDFIFPSWKKRAPVLRKRRRKTARRGCKDTVEGGFDWSSV